MTDDQGALPSTVFATELKATRQRKGWTQEELAARLRDLDAPMDRSTVAKIEASKRGVSVDELVFFAVGLGVPPLSLIVPRSGKDDALDTFMQVAPNRSVRAWQATMWLKGHWQLFEFLPFTTVDGVPRPNAATAAAVAAARRFFVDSQPDIEEAAYREWPGIGRAQTLLAEVVLLASRGQQDTKRVLRKLKVVRADLDAEIERAERMLAEGGEE